MQEWINSILITDQIGIIVVIAVFLLGILSVFGCPCNLAMLGSVAGYTGSLELKGKTKTIVTSCIFLLVGIVVSMSIFGCLIGYIGGFFIETLGDYWKLGTGIILIFFGIYILDILPFKMHGISFSFQNKRTGIIGAILFGITIGGLMSLHNICCNPIYPFVMAAIFIKGNILWGLVMLFFYSLGYCIVHSLTMLGIGLGIEKLSTLLSKSAVFIKYIGGSILIVLGFYLLLTF